MCLCVVCYIKCWDNYARDGVLNGQRHLLFNLKFEIAFYGNCLPDCCHLVVSIFIMEDCGWAEYSVIGKHVDDGGVMFKFLQQCFR